MMAFSLFTVRELAAAHPKEDFQPYDSHLGYRERRAFAEACGSYLVTLPGQQHFLLYVTKTTFDTYDPEGGGPLYHTESDADVYAMPIANPTQANILLSPIDLKQAPWHKLSLPMRVVPSEIEHAAFIGGISLFTKHFDYAAVKEFWQPALLSYAMGLSDAQITALCREYAYASQYVRFSKEYLLNGERSPIHFIGIRDAAESLQRINDTLRQYGKAALFDLPQFRYAADERLLPCIRQYEQLTGWEDA